MDTCDTCRYWHGLTYPGAEHGICENTKLDTRHGHDTACDEGCECEGISTGPKFGCIHHAKRVE